jgi:RimJ/RimL family protein N-acetyltransferase
MERGGAGVDEAPIVNIVGERIALGPNRRELIPTYQRWINDFATLRTLGMVAPGPMSLEKETSWYDSQGPSEVRFTIYERATWRPIGGTGFHAVDFRNRTTSFGLMIGEPDARGQGYGTETTILMLDYAFTVLGLHSVMLTVNEFNLAGRRAYEKAGFREFGRRRQARWMAGRFWDDVYMDCLEDGFNSPVLARIFAPDEPRFGDRG